jgi:hypothetical protein
VAVSDLRTHAAGFSQHQRLVIVAFSVLSTARCGDVSDQREGGGLHSARTASTRERYGLSGVVDRLVNPPRREMGLPSVKQNGERHDVMLTSAELLDGACDQCLRFLSPASKGIGVTEGCGDVWCPVNRNGGTALGPGPRTGSLRDPGAPSRDGAIRGTASMDDPSPRRPALRLRHVRWPRRTGRRGQVTRASASGRPRCNRRARFSNLVSTLGLTWGKPSLLQPRPHPALPLSPSSSCGRITQKVIRARPISMATDKNDIPQPSCDMPPDR